MTNYYFKSDSPTGKNGNETKTNVLKNFDKENKKTPMNDIFY